MKELNQKAFTLVELVVTIAVVIVLSVISVPVYRGHVDKAKKTEAYTLLAVIRDAQIRYYGEYENFLRGDRGSAGGLWYTCNDEVLNVNARTNKYVTWFCIGSRVGIGTGDHGFMAHVVKPNDLRNIAGKSQLVMWYDLTGGVTFDETSW